MVKNKVLTPVLAAVLGVTVAGSGVAYYFVGSNNNSKENGKNTTALADVKENISNTINEAQKAVNGELDFAYDSSVKMTFGEGMSEEAGVSVKPIEYTISTKQKGQNTEADFGLKYDGNALATLNTVYSRDNKTAYVQIPELNSAYLTVTADGVKDSLNSLLEQQGTDLSALEAQMPSFDSVNFEALEKDMESYVDCAKEQFPDATAGDNLTGDIDGNEYYYTTKVYSISGTDVQNVMNALVDKATTDENFKGIFDEFASQSGTTYDDAVAQIKESMSASFANWDEADKTIDFNVYYDGEDVKGFSYDAEGVVCKCVVIADESVEAVDMNVSAEGTNITTHGSVKVEDDKANGSYEYKITAENTNITTSVAFSDVVATDDKFSGTVSTKFSVTNEGGTSSGQVDIVSDSTADNTNLTVDVSADDEKIVTVDYTMKKTEASDVTVPSGTLYNMLDENEINSYMQSCDTEGFANNLKNALGEELWNTLEQSAQQAESDISGMGTEYSEGSYEDLTEEELQAMFSDYYDTDDGEDA